MIQIKMMSSERGVDKLIEERKALLEFVILKCFRTVKLPQGCENISQLDLAAIDAQFVLSCASGSVPVLDLSRIPLLKVVQPTLNQGTTKPSEASTFMTSTTTRKPGHIRKESNITHTPPPPPPPPPGRPAGPTVKPTQLSFSPSGTPPSVSPLLPSTRGGRHSRTSSGASFVRRHSCDDSASSTPMSMSPMTLTPPQSPMRVPPMVAVQPHEILRTYTPPPQGARSPQTLIPSTPPPPPPPKRTPADVWKCIDDLPTLRMRSIVVYEELLIRSGWLSMCSKDVRDALLDVLRPALVICAATHAIILKTLAPQPIRDLISVTVLGNNRRASLRVLTDAERKVISVASADTPGARKAAILSIEQSQTIDDETQQFLDRQRWLFSEAKELGIADVSQVVAQWMWTLLTPMYVPNDEAVANTTGEDAFVDAESLEPLLLFAESVFVRPRTPLMKANAFMHSLRIPTVSVTVNLLRETLQPFPPMMAQCHSIARSEIIRNGGVMHPIWGPVLNIASTALGRNPEVGFQEISHCLYEAMLREESTQQMLQHKATSDELSMLLTDVSSVYDEFLSRNNDQEEYKTYIAGALLRLFSTILSKNWNQASKAITPEYFDALKVVHKVVSVLQLPRTSWIWLPFAWMNEPALLWAAETQASSQKFVINAIAIASWKEENATLPDFIHPCLYDVLSFFHQQLPALETILCENYTLLFQTFSQNMKLVMLHFLSALGPQSLDLPEAVMRFNTVERARRDFPTFVKALHTVWVSATPEVPPLNDVLVMMSIESVGKDVMGTLLKAVCSAILSEALIRQHLGAELYAIDMKHYKKYKHDKKTLAQSPYGHLVPMTSTTMDTVLNDLHRSLSYVFTRTELKRTILKCLYEMFVSEVINVLLCGGPLRWFHEAQAENLYKDTMLITEFFDHASSEIGGECHMEAPKNVMELQGIITGAMATQSEDLIQEYNALAKDNATDSEVVNPKKEFLRKVLQHRKDQAAKKFVGKVGELKEK
eukprot:PhF_6_TR36560/c1_g1_i1/m.53980